MFRLIEARRNEIRSRPPPFAAKPPGCPSASPKPAAFRDQGAALPSSSVASAPISRSCWRGRRPESGDQRQDFGEHLPRHRDLGHLKRNVAAVADDLGADLDQLLPQAGQRPRLRRLRHGEGSHEIAEIVCQGMELKANRVGGEGAARQAGPLDRTLAFFDVLLAGAAVVVEADDALRRPGQIGDDEANPRAKLARMPLDLGDHPPGLLP
jgi:hypothetical protein